jgi:multidrug resistance efflux pump
MPRMLRRAAVLGATAHVASNRGAAKAQQQQQQQQAAAAPPPPVAEPAAPAAAPAATTDSYAELMRLKELFDAGVLTQEEFDAQKTKILAG